MRNKGIAKLIFALMVSFLVYNIAPLSVNLLTYTVGRPYTDAKIRLAVAKTVNDIYILPISFVSDIDTKWPRPFKQLRDGLYEEGINRIPEGDAERDLWWIELYFKEYEWFYAPPLRRYASKKVDKPRIPLKMLSEKTEEIYKHLINSLEVKPVKDSKFHMVRFYKINEFAYSSYKDRFVFLVRVHAELNPQKTNALNRNAKASEEFRRLLERYIEFKKNILQEHPEEYQYYLSHDESKYKDPLLVYWLAGNILFNEYYNGTFDCEKVSTRAFIDTYNFFTEKYLPSEKAPRKYMQYIEGIISDKTSTVTMLIIMSKCKGQIIKDLGVWYE